MRSTDLHRRLAALALTLLLGVTSTGLPSHHHDSGQDGPVVADGSHHGHGVLLVDGSERILTQTASAALPSTSVDVPAGLAPEVVTRVAEATSEPPEAQPPPSARPRAPPVHG